MQGKNTSASAQKAPISSHPIFPVVIAIWFAALLGIGSLIIPAILFEKIFAVTGISSLVPAAQAPLGFTARMLIAIVAAASGAIAGIFVARKVAASQSTRKSGIQTGDFDAEDERDGESKRPISALEELGSESLDEPIEDAPVKPKSYKGKRRSLAVTDESGPSDFLEFAPLPGGDIAFDEETLLASSSAHQPLDLDEFADESDEADDEELIAELNGPFARPAAPQTTQGAEASAVDFASVDTSDSFRSAVAQSQTETPAADALREELATMTEPTDHNPAGQQDFGSYNPLADKHENDQPYAKPFAPAESQENPFAEPVAQAPVEPVASNAKPLNELGMVELVERFAMALQSKNAAPAAAPASAAASEETQAEAAPQFAAQAAEVEHAEIPASFQPAFTAEPQPVAMEPVAQPAVASAEEPAASPLVFRRSSTPQSTPQDPANTEAPATPFAAPQNADVSVPPALQPLGVDGSDEDEDDFEETAELALSINALRNPQPQQQAEPAEPAAFAPPAAHPSPNFAAPEPVAATATDAAFPQTAESDDSYSSLLNMRNALGKSREFVRIEDDAASAPVEPVVVFPGQDSTHSAPEPAAPQFAPPQAADTARPFDGPAAQPVNGAAKPAQNAGETERALREALEKLQRMSGAA